MVSRRLFWGGQEQCGSGRGALSTLLTGWGETWDSPAARPPGHYRQLGRGSSNPRISVVLMLDDASQVVPAPNRPVPQG